MAEGRKKCTFSILAFVISFLVPWISSEASLPQSANVVKMLGCTGQNPLRYAHYGCWCGLFNTGGKTLDELDRCCKNHDLCFRRVRISNNLSTVGALATPYSFRCKKKRPICGGGNAAGKGLCECDRAFAVCTSAHQREYSLKNILLPWSRNKRC